MNRCATLNSKAASISKMSGRVVEVKGRPKRLGKLVRHCSSVALVQICSTDE